MKHQIFPNADIKNTINCFKKIGFNIEIHKTDEERYWVYGNKGKSPHFGAGAFDSLEDAHSYIKRCYKSELSSIEILKKSDNSNLPKNLSLF